MFGSKFPNRATISLGLLAGLLAVGCAGATTDDVEALNGTLGPGNGLTSDDFNAAALDPALWNVIDPQGDGTVELVGVGTSDAQLLLSVPQGTVHDAWSSNTTLRAMQQADDVDFEVEVKFESEPSQKYQGQGLLIEQDGSNYIRFDVYSDGKSLKVFSASFANGSPSVRANQRITGGAELYLRLARSADQWTARYSVDGSTWQTATTFSHAMTVSSAGVFASNYNPNPAYTAVIDYFFEVSSPVVPEDGPLCDPADSLVLTTQATNGAILKNPDLSSYSCGDVVTLTAQPDVGATFLGWGGALSGTANPETVTINADTTVTASFDLDVTPPQVSNVNATASETSAVVSWQTDELSTGLVEFGLSTSYELGAVASSTLTTTHSVTLPGLAAGQVYHYRIVAEDSFGNGTSGADATFTTNPSVCSLVLTTQATNGSILRSPNLSTYDCGDVVTLTAQPDAGATFTGWGGALSGTINPETVTINADTTVTASFALDTSPPVVTNVTATAGSASAAIGWQTNELAVGLVEYGLTQSYELGSVVSSSLSTQHSVALSGLSEGSIYHYRITAADGSGNSTTLADATFTTTTSGGGTGGTGGSGGTPGALLSDDFYSGVLDPILWDVVDPQGDGTVQLVGAGTPDAQLLLSVPQGTVHDAWTNNTALRVMQPTDDQDFEIEVKFESIPTQKYQGQGLVVEQDESNYVRFDVYSDGKSLKVFSATFSNGSASVQTSKKINAGSTIYLRLARSSDQWTARYSDDGSNWQTATSFSHALAVSSAGVFASNYNPNPAYTAVVDYFFDVASPIEPEDDPPCDPADQFSLSAAAVGPGIVVRAPSQSSYSCGDVVTLTAQPDAGATFVGWSGSLGGTSTPVNFTVNADASVTATFDLDVAPPQIGSVNVATTGTSATVSWQTDEASTGFVEVGLTESYELGSVASSTLSTTHSVVLPGLVSEQLHHYRITATDSLGNSATSADATFTTASTSGGPSIDVWHGSYQVFGDAGIPQRFVNVLGNVSDSDGIASLTYSLDGGPESPLSMGPDGRRLERSGDFNVEIDYSDLIPGTNAITIHASDTLGNVSAKSVTVEYVDTVVTPIPYSIDWGTVTDVSDVAQIVDGKWSLVSNGLRVAESGYDRLVAIGDLQWTNYEATVEITLNAPLDVNTTYPPFIGLAMRWTGHFDWNGSQPRTGWYPLGCLLGYGNSPGISQMKGYQSSGATISGDGRPEPTVGVPYIYKMRGEPLPNGNIEYSMKMWPTGQSEPSTWSISHIESQPTASGSLLVVVHEADITIGDVSVVPIGN